jgi:hypothetical protein
MRFELNHQIIETKNAQYFQNFQLKIFQISIKIHFNDQEKITVGLL